MFKEMVIVNGSPSIMQTVIRLGGTLLSGTSRKNTPILLSKFICVSINGGPTILVDQPNTGGGHVILSVPLKLDLRNGTNSLTFGANQSCRLISNWAYDIQSPIILISLAYAGDLDRIIVYTQN